jgi:hypothetical protein
MRSRDREDEISAVLGDCRYAERFYFPELRTRVLGAHSRELIGVSRYYLLLRPPVVVDFEPSPLEGKFYLDEKRRFLGERGVVYVPIFLRERLTPLEFRRRLNESRQIMEAISRVAKEDAALAAATQLAPTHSDACLDHAALRVLAATGPNLRGSARCRALARIRREFAAASVRLGRLPDMFQQ